MISFKLSDTQVSIIAGIVIFVILIWSFFLITSAAKKKNEEFAKNWYNIHFSKEIAVKSKKYIDSSFKRVPGIKFMPIGTSDKIYLVTDNTDKEYACVNDGQKWIMNCELNPTDKQKLDIVESCLKFEKDWGWTMMRMLCEKGQKMFTLIEAWSKANGKMYKEDTLLKSNDIEITYSK